MEESSAMKVLKKYFKRFFSPKYSVWTRYSIYYVVDKSGNRVAAFNSREAAETEAIRLNNKEQ
jgi:hypothetical protein